MTKEAQQHAIVVFTGAAKHRFDSNGQCPDCMMFRSEDPDNYCPLATIPNYLWDLNAMHAAEKAIDPESVAWQDYPREVWEAMEHSSEEYWGTIHATAAQRAEAFLRALNLWKE